MIKFAVVLLLPVALVSAPTAEASRYKEMKLSVDKIDGTGCPNGSAHVIMNDDQRSFTVMYDDRFYRAKSGPGVDPNLAVRDCQIDLTLDGPQGYAFSVFGVDYRGSMVLGADNEASLWTSYRFADWNSGRENSFKYQGGGYTPFREREGFKLSDAAFAPCGSGKKLTIKSSLRIDKVKPGGNSMIYMESTDAGTYKMTAKKC